MSDPIEPPSWMQNIPVPEDSPVDDSRVQIMVLTLVLRHGDEITISCENKARKSHSMPESVRQERSAFSLFLECLSTYALEAVVLTGAAYLLYARYQSIKKQKGNMS